MPRSKIIKKIKQTSAVLVYGHHMVILLHHMVILFGRYEKRGRPIKRERINKRLRNTWCVAGNHLAARVPANTRT